MKKDHNDDAKQPAKNKHGGAGRNQRGRPKAVRPVDKHRPIYLFQDQVPKMTPGEVRQAVDDYINLQKQQHEHVST